MLNRQQENPATETSLHRKPDASLTGSFPWVISQLPDVEHRAAGVWAGPQKIPGDQGSAADRDTNEDTSTRTIDSIVLFAAKHFLRSGFTAYTELSLVTGLSCPRRQRDAKHHRRLDASVGAPGPRDFAVRDHAVRRPAPPRPPQPRLALRDDRDAPLWSRRDK